MIIRLTRAAVTMTNTSSTAQDKPAPIVLNVKYRIRNAQLTQE